MAKKYIDVMDTTFRDGFQSVFGGRVLMDDFLPAVAAARDAGISHFEFGGGARFQSLYFYLNEDAFEMMDKFRAIAGPDANLQTLAQQDEAASALRKNLPLALKRLMGAPVALTFLFREGEADSERGHYLRTTYLHPYLYQLDQLFEQATAAGHFRTVAPAARHVLVTGFLRTLVVPGLLQQELNPHLQNTDTINALIDDAVSILFEGFSLTLPPFSAGANHE